MDYQNIIKTLNDDKNNWDDHKPTLNELLTSGVDGHQTCDKNSYNYLLQEEVRINQSHTSPTRHINITGDFYTDRKTGESVLYDNTEDIPIRSIEKKMTVPPPKHGGTVILHKPLDRDMSTPIALFEDDNLPATRFKIKPAKP